MWRTYHRRGSGTALICCPIVCSKLVRHFWHGKASVTGRYQPGIAGPLVMWLLLKFLVRTYTGDPKGWKCLKLGVMLVPVDLEIGESMYLMSWMWHPAFTPGMYVESSWFFWLVNFLMTSGHSHASLVFGQWWAVRRRLVWAPVVMAPIRFSALPFWWWALPPQMEIVWFGLP